MKQSNLNQQKIKKRRNKVSDSNELTKQTSRVELLAEEVEENKESCEELQEEAQSWISLIGKALLSVIGK